MNVTKNKLIEALNYLGEFPKTSLKAGIIAFNTSAPTGVVDALSK